MVVLLVIVEHRRERMDGQEGGPKSVSCDKNLYEQCQYLESPALWFTTVELNRRHNIMGHPDILTSLLRVST
jgi:hypothetical protein